MPPIRALPAEQREELDLQLMQARIYARNVQQLRRTLATYETQGQAVPPDITNYLATNVTAAAAHLVRYGRRGKDYGVASGAVDVVSEALAERGNAYLLDSAILEAVNAELGSNFGLGPTTGQTIDLPSGM